MPDTSASSAQPRVTLIIPLYQTALYLPDCLDSVLAQTYRQLEVLLVDDGSTDGSSAIARAYASRDSRFRYILRENGGLSAARNTGLDAATGEWIAFMDSDDTMPPHAIQTLLDAALTHHTAMAMGAYTECHETPPFHFRRAVPAKAGVWRGTAQVQRYFLTDGQFLCHMWTKLFRRDVFAAYRFPEGKIYEDNFALPHLLEQAGSVAVVNRSIYHYQVRPGSITTHKGLGNHMDGLEARLQYADFMRHHHPELVPLANDAALSFACNLLGRMEHIGIRHVQDEWDAVIAVMRELLPQAALQNPLYRLAGRAFNKDPRILAKFTRALLRLDRMI